MLLSLFPKTKVPEQARKANRPRSVSKPGKLFLNNNLAASTWIPSRAESVGTNGFYKQTIASPYGQGVSPKLKMHRCSAPPTTATSIAKKRGFGACERDCCLRNQFVMAERRGHPLVKSAVNEVSLSAFLQRIVSHSGMTYRHRSAAVEIPARASI